MSFAPPVQLFLDSAPPEPLDFLTAGEQRELMRHLSDLNYLRFGQRAEHVAAVTDHAVPARTGEVIVRAYRPCMDDTPRPAHIFLHGGGWWLGSIDERVNQAICRYRCVHARCVVLAIGYPLAPEYPFPAAIEDIHAALCWIHDHASSLGIDGGVISIGGISAGANLAAAVTLRARESGPRLALQLLEVPAVDLTGQSLRTAVQAAELRPMAGQLDEFDTGVGRYLSDQAQATSPLASPLLAGDLSGLPPAHVRTAEFDPLRAEGELYARRLAEAGVPVTTARQPGGIHAISYLTRVWPPARDWQEKTAAIIRQAHQQATAGTLCSAVGHDREGGCR
jgi:acetyl esterase